MVFIEFAVQVLINVIPSIRCTGTLGTRTTSATRTLQYLQIRFIYNTTRNGPGYTQRRTAVAQTRVIHNGTRDDSGYKQRYALRPGLPIPSRCRFC